jgi:hypothetical protein
MKRQQALAIAVKKMRGRAEREFLLDKNCFAGDEFVKIHPIRA